MADQSLHFARPALILPIPGCRTADRKLREPGNEVTELRCSASHNWQSQRSFPGANRPPFYGRILAHSHRLAWCLFDGFLQRQTTAFGRRQQRDVVAMIKRSHPRYFCMAFCPQMIPLHCTPLPHTLSLFSSLCCFSFACIVFKLYYSLRSQLKRKVATGNAIRAARRMDKGDIWIILYVTHVRLGDVTVRES